MTKELSKNKSAEINTNFDTARREDDKDKFSVTFNGPIMPIKKISKAAS